MIDSKGTACPTDTLDWRMARRSKMPFREVLPALRIAFWFFVAVFFGIERFVDEGSRSYRASVGMFLIATCGMAVIFLIALVLGVLIERWSLRSSQAGSLEQSDEQPGDA